MLGTTPGGGHRKRFTRSFGLRRLIVLSIVALGALALSGVASANSIQISGSMEGAIKITPGDIVSAGYIFQLNNPVAQTVTFAGAQITFSGKCSTGGTGSFTVPISSGPYQIAAGDNSTHPGSNEKDPATFEGSATAQGMCPNNGVLDASSGATFTADLQSTNTASDVKVQFHYRDPNAKGKGNYDCSASSSAALGADVCGASWSGTITLKPDAAPPTCSNGQVLQNGQCVTPPPTCVERPGVAERSVRDTAADVHRQPGVAERPVRDAAAERVRPARCFRTVSA